MEIDDLRTWTTLQLGLAIQTRIGAARIACMTDEAVRAGHEIDCASRYIDELVQRWDDTTTAPTQEA